MQTISKINLDGREYRVLVRHHKSYRSMKLAKDKPRETDVALTDEQDFLSRPHNVSLRRNLLEGKTINL